ncbi:MAG TPA: hypothetical protein VN622_13780 [Clostridia bacterium]|nr:hypothetical protein [Clostridia bacterium]
MEAVLAHLTRLNVTYRLKIDQQSPEIWRTESAASASRKADLLN